MCRSVFGKTRREKEKRFRRRTSSSSSYYYYSCRRVCVMILLRRKRAAFSLSRFPSKEYKREREYIFTLVVMMRGVFFCRFRNEGTQRSSKIPPLLRFKYSFFSSGHQKILITNSIYLILQILQCLLRRRRRFCRRVSRVRRSSSASSFAEREQEREREREREREKVGKLVEQRFKTRAAKTTKLELGILSFCLLTIISSSLSNP